MKRRLERERRKGICSLGSSVNEFCATIKLGGRSTRRFLLIRQTSPTEATGNRNKRSLRVAGWRTPALFLFIRGSAIRSKWLPSGLSAASSGDEDIFARKPTRRSTMFNPRGQAFEVNTLELSKLYFLGHSCL